MKLLRMTLYGVQVYSTGGLTGTFKVAAADSTQALAMGNAWAEEHDIKPTNVRLLRTTQTIYIPTS